MTLISRLLLVGLLAIAVSTPALAQGAAGAPAVVQVPAAPAPSEDPIDLIRDRPTVVSTIVSGVGSVLWGVWDKVSGVVSVILPPSPTSLSKSSTAEDEQELVKLLGYAGYKLKEIDSQVGIIPTIAFKFALTRELSEADWDYLEYRIELSRFRTPGLAAAVQRAIVETVMAVNTSSAYQVSELKVQILPLPKVAFSVTPKITTLGEESSALMRAIQRMEKRLRGDIANIGGKVLPPGVLRGLVEYRDGLVIASTVLFALAIGVELRRRVRAAAGHRAGPALPLGLLGVGVLAWVAFSLLPISLVGLAAGVAVFGITSLLVVTVGGPAAPSVVASAPPVAGDAQPAA